MTQKLKANWKTFAASAVLAVGGALASLDWSQIFSAKTAGIIGVGIGAALAAIKLATASPDQPAQ